MTRISIFYHCALIAGSQPLFAARPIIREQMETLKSSGLEKAASEIIVGINGIPDLRTREYFPVSAKIKFHPKECCTENRTILMLQEWAKTHPNWFVLYFHSKGATKIPESHEAHYCTTWRDRMMLHCVKQWRQCVKDLETCEAVGCHWQTGQGQDGSQSLFGGNFWFATSNFLATLPLITERHRIKTSGIDAVESRYESEIILGNGPRLPKVKNYYAGPLGT